MTTKKTVRKTIMVIPRKPARNSLSAYKCKFCGYSWIPRRNIPQECPNCKRRNWYK